jgi:hypothetical protein
MRHDRKRRGRPGSGGLAAARLVEGQGAGRSAMVAANNGHVGRKACLTADSFSKRFSCFLHSLEFNRRFRTGRGSKRQETDDRIRRKLACVVGLGDNPIVLSTTTESIEAI